MKSLRSASRSALQIWQEIMSRGRGERLKPLDDVATAGANVLPFHLQEPDFSRMEEEIDQSCVVAALALRECDGVDTHDIFIGCVSRERVQQVQQFTRADATVRSQRYSVSSGR